MAAARCGMASIAIWIAVFVMDRHGRGGAIAMHPLSMSRVTTESKLLSCSPRSPLSLASAKGAGGV